MKYLRLRSNELSDGISTLAAVRACVDHPAPGGLKLADVRARVRLLDAAEQAETSCASLLELEDQDADTLRKCVQTMQWGKAIPQIVVFSDAVDNMPSQRPDGA